ncbi:hypothetical protein [Amycolatopsis sp. NPDC051061]|uniref:hypothetical protein n=1 Tax=Amycolatopsis sp. NPDC051061 TaxID=3155042 RepID=UPI00341B7121
MSTNDQPQAGPTSELSTSDAAGSDYTVVLQATSSARFLPEGGWELSVYAPEIDSQPLRVRAFTRWVDDEGKKLPRELVVEVRGHALSLDEAVAKFPNVARPIANLVGFVANVRVGLVEVVLAYETFASGGERDYLQVFIAEERGPVPPGRSLEVSHLDAVCLAFMGAADNERISRALRHYELALREWYIGGEWLALNYLWIAAENLTKAVIRKIIARTDVSEEEIANEHSLVTDDPNHPRWRELLGARIRSTVIFRGDAPTYRTAKKASDGLEHGILELNAVAKHAIACADKTFQYVRRTIVDLLDLPKGIAEKLNDVGPMDVQSLRKVVRGHLTGTAEDPAEEGERYPRLVWSSGVDSVMREGSAFTITHREKMTVRTHPDIGFRIERLGVHGRLESGQAPAQISDEEIVVERESASPLKRLLDAVIPMVDLAVGSGVGRSHTQASLFAFNLFGQGTSLFQAVRQLIVSFLPIEAFATLHGLVMVAARFEQMANLDGPRFGVAVREALEAISGFGADAEHVAARQSEVLATAEAQNVTVPSRLADPQSSFIYRSLAVEMSFATWSVNGAYGTAGLHVRRVDSQRAGFHTKLSPGPLSDLVGSAAVIAMLTLLGHASLLFGWSVDRNRLETLLSEARELNDSAAQLDLYPSD